MADIYEQNLAQKSSLTTSDFIRVVGSDNVSYKQQLSNVLSAMRITPYTNITTLGTTDLNTWMLSGIYIQNASANATTARHYPVAGTIGFLEVIAYTTDTERVLQRYTTISNCDVYERIRNYDGTWYSWVKQPTRAEVDALTNRFVQLGWGATISFTCATNHRFMMLAGNTTIYMGVNFSDTVTFNKVAGSDSLTFTTSRSGTTITITASANTNISVLVF